jgi:hypothetical protein
MTTYFVKCFRGKKLSATTSIPKFKLGFDPLTHIEDCEREWRRIGYKDERVWPHMFPNTLDDFLISGTKLKRHMVKHSPRRILKKILSRILHLTHRKLNLTEAVKEIKDYIEKPSTKITQEKENQRST